MAKRKVKLSSKDLDLICEALTGYGEWLVEENHLYTTRDWARRKASKLSELSARLTRVRHGISLNKPAPLRKAS